MSEQLEICKHGIIKLACPHCKDEFMLQKEITALKSQLAIAREGLESIAKNTCCDTCQEAAKVAAQTLERMKGE